MEILLFLGFLVVAYLFYSRKNKGSKHVSGVSVKGTSIKISGFSGRDDDDFATFTVSMGHDEEQSTNSAPGRWVSAGETLDFNGTTIVGGNFYIGGQLKSLDGYSTESSLIDDSLRMKVSPYTFQDESLGYWPSYISLSPSSRGAYISWLASERNAPDAPLGYVFIYFYGLERRITCDEVDDVEFEAIFEEVQRLKRIYGENRSFFGYSARLLDLMCIQRPKVVSLKTSEPHLEAHSLLFKFQLASAVSEGLPISAELAFSWLRFHPEYSFKTPARRCEKEFQRLFHLQYRKRYGDGITVKPNKTKLKIEYYPASSSLRGISLEQHDLPDPSMLKGPIKKLITIADTCNSALEAYSRYLGKKDTSSNDVAAVLLLPDELASTDSDSLIGRFKAWADDQVESTEGLISVVDFWEKIGLPQPDKFYKKDIELLQGMAQKAGYGIAPDPRYHHAKPQVDGKIVLFPKGHGTFFEPSKSFNSVGMAIRLGAMVATIDQHVDEAESAALKRLIDHDTELSPTEKCSLHAYLTWRLNTPSSMAGLKARLEKLQSQEKNVIGHLLVSIALADGKVDPSEIKQLEKLYTALGLDKASVTSDVHALSSSKTSIMSQSVSDSNNLPHKTDSSFKLDKASLALHESETKEVQNLLGTIFVSDEGEPQVATSETNIQTPSAGLDSCHRSLYESLKVNEHWSVDDAEKLSQEFGLMLSGAVETINDWAFDRVDAPVLDEDDGIYVDMEIVEELEAM